MSPTHGCVCHSLVSAAMSCRQLCEALLVGTLPFCNTQLSWKACRSVDSHLCDHQVQCLVSASCRSCACDICLALSSCVDFKACTYVACFCFIQLLSTPASYSCLACLQDYNPKLDAEESLQELKAMGLATEAVGNPAYHKGGYIAPQGANAPGSVADSARGIDGNGHSTANPAYANGNGFNNGFNNNARNV